MLVQSKSNKVVDFEGEDLLDKLGSSEKPMIVDFYAQWCGPCKILVPVLESISEKFEEVLSIIKVDVDKHQKIAQEHGVQSVPTLVFFLGCKEIKRIMGYINVDKLTKVIEETFKIKV